MKNLSRPDACSSGLTLLELIVAIAIGIAIATSVIVISSTFKKRAEKVKCISQMRTLHAAFTAHLTDKGQWPQLPEDMGEWNESKFFGVFIRALEPYGAAQDTWICPADKIYIEQSEIDEDTYFGTYVPTPFDKYPATPLRWNQPWVIERGDMHGKGAHILMPDGSVNESRNPFYGR